MKHYKCKYYECDAPDNCCLFCRNCTNVFWDYTHGAYMFICEKGFGNWRTCNGFEEEDNA